MIRYDRLRVVLVVAVLLSSSVPATLFGSYLLGSPSLKAKTPSSVKQPPNPNLASLGIDCGYNSNEAVANATGYPAPDGALSSGNAGLTPTLDSSCTWAGFPDGSFQLMPLVSDNPVLNPGPSCCAAPSKGGGFTAEIVFVQNASTVINGFDISLSWDTKILSAVQFDQGGLSWFGANSFTATNIIDNTLGQAELSQAILSPPSPTALLSGNQVLFRIRFDVVGVGTTSLHIFSDVVIDANLTPNNVHHNTIDGSFTNNLPDLIAAVPLGYSVSWTFTPNPEIPGSALSLLATASCASCTLPLSYRWDTDSVQAYPQNTTAATVEATGLSALITAPTATLLAHRVTLIVADAAGRIAEATRRLPLALTPPPAQTVPVNTNVPLTAEWLGGIPPYSGTTGAVGVKWTLCNGTGFSQTICTSPNPSTTSTPLQTNSVPQPFQYKWAGVFTGTVQATDTAEAQLLATSLFTGSPSTVVATFPVNVTANPLGTLSQQAYTVTVTSNAPSGIPAGNTVGFTATVAYAATYGSTASRSTAFSYEFHFGDNSIALATGGLSVSTSHKYTTAGSFTVVVIAQETSSNALAKIKEVGRSTQVITPLLCPTSTPCDFTVNPTSPTAGTPATFTASVNGGTEPYTFSWDFGDSTTLATTNPVTHTYAAAGTFNVKITITDSSIPTPQTSGVTHSVVVQPAAAVPTVTVNNPTPNPANTGVAVTVTFTVTSTATVTGITVNWGDGTAVDTLAGTSTSDMHTYASTGALKSQVFTITVTATNSAGPGSGITMETVNDRPPTVTISTILPNPASTGTTVTVSFTATDPDGTVASLSVDWGDGSIPTSLAGTATSATHTYASTGSAKSQSFTITVTATDNSGSTGSAQTTETVNDRPPVVAVTSPTPNPALTGQLVTVTFSAGDPDGTVSSISVNWGDTTTPDTLAGTATSDTHTYTSGGSFTITVTATDNSGSTTPGTTSETVSAPTAPTVTITNISPNPANTGVMVTVTFTVSSTATVTGITVNWGDGTAADNLAGTATSDTHTYASTGAVKSQIFTVTVSATSSAGTGSAHVQETINDRAPVVTITSVTPNPTSTGVMVTVTFTASDPDGTVTGINVNWGDGTTIDSLPGSAISDTHTYTTTGTSKSQSFTITVTATDNSGSTTPATTSETINDRSPVVTVTNVSPNPANTGQLVTVTFTANDPDGTISSITVNWGDGTAIDTLAGTATSDTHTYASAGPFTITVTATDNSGSTGQATGSITVAVPVGVPTVMVNNPTPKPANTGVMVTVTFTVGSTATVTGITVNWGDATTPDSLPGTATSDSHTYASTGIAKSQTFTITVTATNSAGPGSGSTTEVVNDLPPVVTISSVTPASPCVGQSVTVSFTSADPDGTVASISVNWGDGTVLDSLPGTATSDMHSYTVGGTFTLTVTATDNSGSTGQATGSVTTVLAGCVPTVTVNSPTPNPADTGMTVTVTFTVSSTVTVTGITVNWGDGTINSLVGTALSDSHSYSSTGTTKSQTFTITVTATSSAGPGSGVTTEVVNDRPPTVTVSTVLPNPANTGQMVTATFTATDPDGTISSISVDWGDSSTPDTLAGTATSDTHIYNSAGSFTVTVTATDNSGSTGQGTGSLTVNIVVGIPTVAVNTPTPNPADTGATVTVTFTVTSTATVTGITVNWGDGTTNTLAGSASSDTHVYANTGMAKSQIFTITVTATNSAGPGSGTTTETINDRPPVASFTFSPTSPSAGQTVSFDASSSTDPDGTIVSYAWNFGDGTTGTGVITTHVYNPASTQSFSVMLTVTDNQGSTGSNSQSITVTVIVTPPIVTISNITPNPANTGQIVTVTFAVSSTATITGITVNWGDGTTDPLTGTATSDTHAYTATGSFTVTVTATNSAGPGSATIQETVTAVTVTPVLLSFQALAPQSPDKGAGQLQVFVNGQHVVDVTPGMTSFASFGPIDITTFAIFGGQNTIAFTNPQTNQFALVKNVTVTQGNIVLLHVGRTQKVPAGGTLNFTFSLPPLVTAGIVVSSIAPLVGEQVTFTSTFTGGTGPFKCIFRFEDEESSVVTGASGTCSAAHDFDDSGTFTVTVLIVGSSASDRVSSSIGVAVGQTAEDDD